MTRSLPEILVASSRATFSQERWQNAETASPNESRAIRLADSSRGFQEVQSGKARGILRGKVRRSASCHDPRRAVSNWKQP